MAEMKTRVPGLVTVVLCYLLCANTALTQTPGVRSASFQSKDTYAPGTDNDADAKALLGLVGWEPEPFEVVCTSTPGLRYDALVRFDSPRPSGDEAIDRVALTWYAARDEHGQPIEAPAVLMVHSIQSQMVVADVIARHFKQEGLHAFVLQLPGYGERWKAGRHPAVVALEHGVQSIADCRRAYDAIRVLPNVKPGPIALQGTSLGGFVAATAGALDGVFDPVLLVISGADAYHAIDNGLHDALYLKLALSRVGYEGEKLRALLEPVEPMHVVHRLNADRTWLFSADKDATIPRHCSDMLARLVGLDKSHHIRLDTNHYTSMLLLPAVSKQMARLVLEGAGGDTPTQGSGD